MIGDEEVRERFGVEVSAAHVTIVERDKAVEVLATNSQKSARVQLTPYEARKLAYALRRIAWRVEARQ